MNARVKRSNLVLGLLALAACVPVAPVSQQATILDGAVTVGVPAGYCLDRTATREDGDSAVVIMGKCRADSNATPAVLTLTVGPAGSGQVLTGPQSYLAGYFMSRTGRAAMAVDGNPDTVTVDTAKGVGPAIVMRLTDRRSGTYWRGVEPVAGRAVTISVIATPVEQGEGVLGAALAAMRRANP
jgi:hypothetical protein